MTREARGECPSCGMPIPFAQTLKKRGEPFACRACDTMIVIPRVGMLLIGGLLIGAILIGKFVGIIAVLAAILLIAVGDWRLARTHLADRPDQAQDNF